MKNLLRKIRTVLAVLFQSAITLLFLDFTGTIHHYLGWMTRTQLVPAVLALNVDVIIGLVILTLLFGRIYCSVICPLGIFQDIISRISDRKKKNRFHYSLAKDWLRYAVLLVFVVAAVAGIGSVVALIEPYSAYGRIASWAFRYAGTFPDVLTVLSGMTFMEHLQDNIRTYAPLEPVNQNELKLLEDTAKLMVDYPLIPCTACQYCMHCPYGINIPAIFQHYNKCVCENNYPESPQTKNYKEARRVFLIGYDRSVPKLRQASHCIGCGKCVEHCLQSIKIPKEMHRIDEYVEKLKQGTL